MATRMISHSVGNAAISQATAHAASGSNMFFLLRKAGTFGLGMISVPPAKPGLPAIPGWRPLLRAEGQAASSASPGTMPSAAM